MQSNIRKALAQEVAKIPGARLVDVTLVQRNGKTTAWAVARTPEPISPEQVAHLNDLASKVTGRDIGLIVRSVITAETTRYGNVYEPEAHPGEIPTLDDHKLKAQHLCSAKSPSAHEKSATFPSEADVNYHVAAADLNASSGEEA